jgi:hypothetical protein
MITRPDFRNLRISRTAAHHLERPPASAAPPVGDDGENVAVDLGQNDAVDLSPNDAGDLGQNDAVDLGRIAWLGTVLVCLVTVLILALQGYYGYAAVTFAVALAAAINLL